MSLIVRPSASLSDDFADSQRMAKAKKRAVVATDPFPTTPIVPPNFPLLDARLVSTASTKLNWVISEVCPTPPQARNHPPDVLRTFLLQILRYGENEKFLVFSRDASALGLCECFGRRSLLKSRPDLSSFSTT